ncbi:TetR/AcrR family transcriptional regulator [Micromonospora sp. WMMD736]|uniref:TetR/AcrR family transcriptional regulator n=1 Tax=Micromonospora sp. WMMD736 TaxID=3404112 RepID=UPI003B93D69B
MTTSGPAPKDTQPRRIDMLRAAAELISERGFAATRVADVANRAGVSAPLVIYYFGTRERLLVDALQFSENSFNEVAERILADISKPHDRISWLIKWGCWPPSIEEEPGYWGLWFDLWTQAFRHDEVKLGRAQIDARWRGVITAAVEQPAQEAGVDARTFALEFAALLDGLVVQVALEDPEITPAVAYDIAMRFAEQRLRLLDRHG